MGGYIKICVGALSAPVLTATPEREKMAKFVNMRFQHTQARSWVDRFILLYCLLCLLVVRTDFGGGCWVGGCSCFAKVCSLRRHRGTNVTAFFFFFSF